MKAGLLMARAVPALSLLLTLATPAARSAPPPPVFPGKSWARAAPASVGLDAAALERFSDFLGAQSHGVVVRYGRLVHSWGAYDQPRDVASA